MAQNVNRREFVKKSTAISALGAGLLAKNGTLFATGGTEVKDGSQNKDKVGQGPKYGKIPSPQWLREATMCNCLNEGSHNAQNSIGLVEGIPFLIDANEKSVVETIHKKGFRGLAYVRFMDTLIKCWGKIDPPAANSNRPPSRVPFSTDWMDILLMDEEGRFVNTHMDGSWQLSRYLVCANSKTYAQKALELVRQIMDIGVDGLFVDNVKWRRPCFGEGLHVGYSKGDGVVAERPGRKYKLTRERLNKLPEHTHIYPDKDHNYAFRQLLLQIRDLVKSYSKDNVVILNGALSPFADCADGVMHESYICSWAWKGRKRKWSQLKELANKYEPYLQVGGQVVALSYLEIENTEHTIKDDAYFCFAAARVSGFIWTDYLTISDNPAKILYKADLGEIKTPMLTSGNIDYRVCQRGIIAVNGDKVAHNATIHLPGDVDFKILRDLYNENTLQVNNDILQITIPAESGRVYQAI